MKSVIQSQSRLYQPLYFFMLVFLCTTFLLMSPGIATQPAWADADESATEVGLGFASFVTTLPYGAYQNCLCWTWGYHWWVHICFNRRRSRFCEHCLGKVFIGHLRYHTRPFNGGYTSSIYRTITEHRWLLIIREFYLVTPEKL